jgi:hypothetical protein
MTNDNDSDDVVRVAAGDMMSIEFYKQKLDEEGIEARVVGEALGASFGTAIQRSVELWVHKKDAARAEKVIEGLDSNHGKKETGERQKFPNPTSDPNPHRAGGHGPHSHYNANPGS